MKRIIAVLTAAVLMLAVLSACSKTEDVDLNKVMETVNSTYDMGELKSIDSKQELHRYYVVEEDDVKQFAAEFSAANGDYNEVILVEAVDKDAAGRINEALANHLRLQLRDAKSYHPEFVSMLKACEVQQSGNFVYLVINDRYDEIVSTISEALH